MATVAGLQGELIAFLNQCRWLCPGAIVDYRMVGHPDFSQPLQFQARESTRMVRKFTKFREDGKTVCDTAHPLILLVLS